MSETRSAIYGLCDPRDGLLRYVGKTVALTRRVREHANRHDGSHKSRWLRALKTVGLRPDVVVLEDGVPRDQLCEAERWWILLCRLAGCRLTNLTDGGDGLHGLVRTEAHKASISAARTGWKASAETRAKMREVALERPHAVSQRAGISRRNPSAEVRWKIGSANRGKRLTPEHRAKLSEVHRGKRPTAATLAKMSAWQKGRPRAQAITKSE